MIKFLLIGSPELPAEDLVTLYGLENDDYILATDRDPTTYIGHGRCIMLTNRPRNDYIEYKNQRVKEYIDFYGEDETKIKKSGRKPKFKPKEEWAKRLKKRGKM